MLAPRICTHFYQHHFSHCIPLPPTMHLTFLLYLISHLLSAFTVLCAFIQRFFSIHNHTCSLSFSVPTCLSVVLITSVNFAGTLDSFSSHSQNQRLSTLLPYFCYSTFTVFLHVVHSSLSHQIVSYLWARKVSYFCSSNISTEKQMVVTQ